MSRQWIGRQFVTRLKHPDEAGRIVEVISKEPRGSLAFRVRNIAHPGNPSAVGRETVIRAETLDKAWRPVETQTGLVGGTAPDSLAEILEALTAEHDRDHGYGHSGCHTLVLLSAIRAALAECDAADQAGGTPRPVVSTTALRQAMGDAMRAQNAPVSGG